MTHSCNAIVARRRPHPAAEGDARRPPKTSTRTTQVMLFMKGTKIFPQCGF